MKKKKKPLGSSSFINKKATFSYTILDSYVAGIRLLGTEIKSIREGKVNLTDAYAYFDHHGCLLAKGIHINKYAPAAMKNHDPLRLRNLLLTKREMSKLKRSQEDKGNTIVILRLFINDKGLAKIEIGSAKGKKLYDKREAIKERDLKRRIRQNIEQ